MLEREMDDAVSRVGGLAQTVEVVEVSTKHVGVSGAQGGRRSVGAGKTDDGVPRCTQLRDDCRTDVTGSPSNEYMHRTSW
jgi:hypothetical protein